MTSTNALLLQRSSPPPTTNRLHSSRILYLSHSLSMLVDDDIEQVALQQSTEWHHSIIDWLSRESSKVVRQSNMTTTNSLLLQCSSPPTTTNRLHSSRILTHSRCLLMMILNRWLFNDQLSGTIPSSIGSLVNLQELYVNPT